MGFISVYFVLCDKLLLIPVTDAICGLAQTLLETSASMFDNERVTRWLGFFMFTLKTEVSDSIPVNFSKNLLETINSW